MHPSGSSTGTDRKADPASVPLPPRDRLRVLVVAPQPFFAQRGTPINVRQMVQTLCDEGDVVHLATYPMGSAVSIPGLHLHRAMRVPGVRDVPIGFSWRKVVLDALLAIRVWALVLGRRFDVVHAVEESVFFVMPIARLRGIPVIYDMDSSLSEQLEYGGHVRNGGLLRLVRRMELAALQRARLVITVCASLTERVQAMVPNAMVVQIEDCPLDEALRAPDRARVEELRASHGLAGRRVVMYTGNLEGYQAIDLLLDAFARVARADARSMLVLVGGARPQLARLRERTAALDIADRVVLAGPRPASEMPEWMALGDVLVSPRLHGTNTPLKLYSYMWSAVPIVATALPTHTQLLDDTTAVLRAPTADALADGLLDVLARPESFAPLGVAAHLRVARDFSRDVFRRKLLFAYDIVGKGVRSTVATSM